MPPFSTKPDLRAGLAMLVAMAFGTGLVQVPTGTALLIAYPAALGPLPGSFQLSLQLAGSYIALRVLHHLYLLGAHLSLVPWSGTLLTLSVYGFLAFVTGLVVFTRVPMGEAMAALGRLRLPGTFPVVVMVTCRYVPTLLGEPRTICSASGLRSSKARRRYWLRYPLKELEYGVVPVLIRSGRIADELSTAAECRGLDPEHRRSTMTVPRLEAVDWVLMALIPAPAVAVRVWVR